MVMVTVLVIEWNNCFHLFEDGESGWWWVGRLACKRNFGLVLMDVVFRINGFEVMGNGNACNGRITSQAEIFNDSN